MFYFFLIGEVNNFDYNEIYFKRKKNYYHEKTNTRLSCNLYYPIIYLFKNIF